MHTAEEIAIARVFVSKVLQVGKNNAVPSVIAAF